MHGRLPTGAVTGVDHYYPKAVVEQFERRSRLEAKSLLKKDTAEAVAYVRAAGQS